MNTTGKAGKANPWSDQPTKVRVMPSMDDPSIWSITPERMVRWRSVKSLWNCLDEGCLLMPSLDYLMADRGIHAEEHAETETEGTMACFTQETPQPFQWSNIHIWALLVTQFDTISIDWPSDDTWTVAKAQSFMMWRNHLPQTILIVSLLMSTAPLFFFSARQTSGNLS